MLAGHPPLRRGFGATGAAVEDTHPEPPLQPRELTGGVGLGDAQGGGGRREAAQLGDGDQELEGVQVGACDVTAKPRHIRDDMTCSGSGTTARGLGARRCDACLFLLEPVYLPRTRRPSTVVTCRYPMVWAR